MTLSYDQLKAAFGKKNASSSSTENSGFWDKFYPFFKMNLGETAIFRFLPDADDENPFGFIVENRYHELMINGKKKKLACLQMYGEPCPCCEESKRHYDSGDEALGKTFWRKIDYIASGLVIQSPFDYPIKPEEDATRLISIGPKLYKVIESKMANGDFDHSPIDVNHGYNFMIMKTKQGEYADYTTSDFARRSTPVPEQFAGRYKLLDLKKFRYAKVEREAMEAQIEAFMTGRSYADEQPNPNTQPAPKEVPTVSAASHSESTPAPQVSSVTSSAPEAAAVPAGGGSDRAKALIAKLNAQRAAAAAK